MKFGIILTPHWKGDDTQSAVYKEMIDRMVFAEQCGYWSCWTTEHHFANDPAYLPWGWEGARFKAYDLAPDPLVLLTFGAARTSRLRLGTGVLLVNYDNPVRLAERIAMLDVLSEGRLELGLGRGGGVRHSAAFGLPLDDNSSQDRYREALAIMIKAWSGERFSFQGEHFAFPELEVMPTPIQRPHPPLYTSTQNAQNFAEAAAQGLSHCSTTGAWGPASIDAYNARQAVFDQAARQAGRDPAAMLYPTSLFQFCAETDAEAQETAEEYMLNFTAHVEAHYERQRHGGSALGALTNPNAGLDDIKAMNKRAFETNLIGSPKTIAEKLAAFLEKAPSINYILGITDAGGPPREFVHRSMELFAREVMPKFQNLREPAMAGRLAVDA